MHPLTSRTFIMIGVLLAAACAGRGGGAQTTTTAPTTTQAVPETSTTTVSDGPDHREGAPLPRARTEVAGTFWEGEIIVVGGLRSMEVADADVSAYDPVADRWRALPSLPEPLHHTALGVLDGRLYVVGGYGIESARWVARSEVWSLGPGEEQWRAEPPLLTPRGALAVASTGDRLIAIGGVDASLAPIATTEILEAGATEWVSGPEMAQAREHHAAVAVGGKVYAIAGRVSFNLATVEVLEGGVWHPAPDLNDARSGIGAAVVHGVPCVTGGEDFGTGETIGSVECLVDDAWTVLSDLNVPRHGLAVVSVGDVLHVIGGGRRPGASVSDVHEIVTIDVP